MRHPAALALISLVLLTFGGISMAQEEATRPQVAIDTNMGRIVVELEPENAPVTVENFLAYVDAGFYDGTVFHRVIPNFMIQGGGFDEDLAKKPTEPPIENEAKNGLKNERGTIAMARTNDPHSATAQFFINHVDNTSLDHPSFDGWGYAVFGRVIEGMDVVDSIARVATGVDRGMKDVPRDAVVIETARRVE